MSKADWGVKRLCPGCSSLYYDMKKNPATCPKCNTAFDPEALLRSRRKVVSDEAKKKAAAPEAEELEVEEEVADVPDDAVVEDEGDEDVALDVEVEDEK